MVGVASKIAAVLDADRPRAVEQLCDLLRIPSISALSEHREDVVACAEWLAGHMVSIGLEHVSVLPTGGHPVVYGDWLRAPGRPTVLVYGHYDVQPVDPLAAWQTPPFEPTLVGSTLYGRGTNDDKGQLFMHLKVVEAYLKETGALPVNLRMFFEGEEESGSEHLDAFVESHRDLLAADVAVISDTSMFARGLPTITTGLRGLVYLQVDLRVADRDLHSGYFGGAVANPCEVLCHLLSGLKDAQGRVTIAGFYDAVRPLTDAERRAWQELPYEPAAFAASAGVRETSLVGEDGYSALERMWARPTLEINGIWGGFSGEGAKTIIPAEAHAKMSCRLVPDQDPDTVAAAVRARLLDSAPSSVQADVRVLHGGAPSLTPVEHPAVGAALRALERGFPGSRPTFDRSGGSIPVVATFQRVLGIPTVLLGVALAEEGAHAPNEHFDLDNFAGGMRSIAYLWEEMADALTAQR